MRPVYRGLEIYLYPLTEYSGLIRPAVPLSIASDEWALTHRKTCLRPILNLSF